MSVNEENKRENTETMEMSDNCIVSKGAALHDTQEVETNHLKHNGSHSKDKQSHKDLAKDGHQQEAAFSSRPEQEEEQSIGFPPGSPPQEGLPPDTQHLQGTVADDVSQRGTHTADEAGSTDSQHEKPRYKTQVMLVMLMAWIIFSVATSRGFPGVVLLQFTDPDTDDLYLESSDLALFVSIVNAGTMVGSLVSGQMLAPLGARVVILIGLPIGIVAWIGLVFSSQVWILMLCRVLMGFSFALVKPSTVMYMVEVAHKNIRGRMVGVLCIAREIGFSSSYLLDSLELTWRQLSLVYCCCLIPPIIALFFVPDSPRWLVIRGRVAEARKSLMCIRDSHHDVENELVDIVSEANVSSNNKTSFWQQLKFLVRPPTLQTFLLLDIIFISLAFQGSITITPYLMIVMDTPGTPLDPAMGAIVCSCLKMFGTVVCLSIIDFIGRRSIFTVCLSYTCICTTSYGFSYAQLEKDSAASTFVSWLPLISIAALQFLSGILAPVFDVIQGELIPNACRAVSLPLLMLTHSLAVFISLRIFPDLIEILGMQGVFGMFTVVCMASIVLIIVALPEVRGLSLEMINASIHSKKGSNATVTAALTNSHDEYRSEEIVAKQGDNSNLSNIHTDTHLV